MGQRPSKRAEGCDSNAVASDRLPFHLLPFSAALLLLQLSGVGVRRRNGHAANSEPAARHGHGSSPRNRNDLALPRATQAGR